MHLPGSCRKILIFMTTLLSALLLFSAAASACLNTSIFSASFHQKLMEKYDIYGKLERTSANAVQEYVKNMAAGSPGNEEQEEQLAALLDKAVTPEMVRLNADTLVEGLMDYFSGAAQFLPDIYLKPVREKTAAAAGDETAAKATALSSRPLAGIDRISLNVILMYMNRSDAVNLLSEIRLFKFGLSHGPAFLLLLSFILLVPALFLAGKRRPGEYVFRMLVSAGLLSVLSGGLMLLSGLLYLPPYLSSSALAGYVGQDALLGYLESCLRRPAAILMVCGAALAAAGLVIRFIAWGGVRKIFAKGLGRLAESEYIRFEPAAAFLRKHGRIVAVLLLLSLAAGVLLARFEAVKGDFHAKNLSAAFERLKSANTYSTVIAARDETIYAVEVRTTDGQSGDPVPEIPVKIDGRLDSGDKDYSASGTSDASGKARFDIGEGAFKLDFDGSMFPEDYKVPAPYSFDVKTAGIAIITVHLDRAEVRKDGLAEVLVLDSDNKPAANLELAAEERMTDGGGTAAAGKVFSFTNNDGVAIFKLPEGRYGVSFVESAFRQQYILPEPMEIEVDGDATVRYSLKLALREPPADAADN